MTLNDSVTASQCAQILEAMQAGERITPLEAQYKFGTMRLGARIYDLKKRGYKIERERVQVPAKNIKGVATVARYYIANAGTN